MVATKKVADGNRALNIINIIIIVILVVTVIGGFILVHGLEYIGGTRNDFDFTFYSFGLSLLLFLIVPLVAVGAFIVTLINLVFWHRTVGQILFKLALLLIIPVICFCAFEYEVPLVSVFLKGFEQWVLQEADVDAIQAWLVNEGAKHAGKSYHVGDGFPEEFPDSLVNLNPHVISFAESDSQYGPSVEITWFVRGGNYGLIVGFPAKETPEVGHIKLDTGDYEYRRPVKPGAYVFSRG